MEDPALRAVLDESWKTPARWRNALRLALGELRPKLAQTPHDEVARWGRVRLLRFRPSGTPLPCPVLMIPSIINRWYVLDLRPGQSYIEHLVGRGIPVYVLDWGTPGPQDAWATMEDHILRWQGAAVRAACRDAGVAAVHLLGYCLGGTFAAAYTALRPERVAGLIALAAPVSFDDDGLLSSWARNPDLDVDRLVGALGSIPAVMLQASFGLLDPMAQTRKVAGFLEKLWDEGYVERFLALETWLGDNVAFPGATYLRHIKDLYRENALVKGSFLIGGTAVDLPAIACPLLTVLSRTDHIVPPSAASALHDLVASKDRTLLELEGGHIGITVGSRARDGLWTATADWLAARPCPARP